MAIIKDAGNHPAGTTGTTVTFTNALTIASQNNRLLLVAIDGVDGVADLVTKVEWDGEAMTRIYSVRRPSNRWCSYWYLLSPHTGTKNLVVTNSSSAYVEPSIVSYYNVYQQAPEATSQTSGTAAASGTGTNIQIDDGGAGTNLAIVSRTDNPLTVGTYAVAFGGNSPTLNVTTVTAGASVIGVLSTGAGAYVIFASAWKEAGNTLSAVFYPDADTESTSVDGYVARQSVNEALATIIAGAGNGSSDVVGNNDLALVVASATTNQYQIIRRGIFLFDTSSLTSSANIISSTLSLYVTITNNNLGGSASFSLVQSTPASNTALANSDYGNVGSTLQATSLTVSSLLTSAYNSFTLNAAGLSNISKTGITKFGTRMESDRSGSGLTWSSSARESVEGNYSDAGSNKPRLLVIYTLLDFPGGVIMI